MVTLTLTNNELVNAIEHCISNLQVIKAVLELEYRDRNFLATPDYVNTQLREYVTETDKELSIILKGVKNG